jgi:hypothetical protein
MARQTKRQKEIVERVMHEFKHGDLKSGSGRKVRNPKQAIAIGLNEAGASNQQSPSENRRRERQTSSRKAAGGSAGQQGEGRPTRDSLYAEARKRNIPGRSKMSKAELEQALGR